MTRPGMIGSKANAELSAAQIRDGTPTPVCTVIVALTIQ
jgi:hypothetical protein